MRILFLLTLAISLSVPVFASSATATTTVVTTKRHARAKKKMQAFRSDRELKRYLEDVAEKVIRARAARTQDTVNISSAETVMVTSADESITNTQHAGVDEGGIVKLHGNHLVMLRRGRLFTVAIGDGALQPVSSIDAFGPEMDPAEAWYDEMLISGDTVVVIGYSYQRKGAEVGLFNVDAAGQLSYRATYHLRSNDYYSSRNYASRLIGTKLIFYSPLYFKIYADDPFASFPAVRRWHKGAIDDEFRRIVSARRVYRPATELNLEDDVTLHSVTVCDLAGGGFNCEATTVLGPAGNVFYVSPDSVYVWATPWQSDGSPTQSLLFRMPLDGSSPSALRVTGAPTDQFSFLQSDDQHLNVLVRAGSKGDGMWASEVAEGDVALLRIPLSMFSDGSETVPRSNYHQLPNPAGYNFQNRFVHDHLLYGIGSEWNPADDKIIPRKTLYVVDWKRGTWQRLELSHSVERIEQMGADAVIVGTSGKDLQFTAIHLGQPSTIGSTYTRAEAAQGETRSHGFFYKPDGDDSGTLGLPISLPVETAYRSLFETSAAVLFLRNEAQGFRELGELGAQSEKAVDDKCRASCIDWYGNSRPLFLRGRVFALLGYELVEGKLEDGRIREVARLNYLR